MTVSKDDLFLSRLPEADVEVPGVGTVRVRGLNRAEVMSLGKMTDVAERDLHLIAIAMLEPKLSVSEVRRWAEASPSGELEAVSRKVAELSGLLPESAKDVVSTFREGPVD